MLVLALLVAPTAAGACGGDDDEAPGAELVAADVERSAPDPVAAQAAGSAVAAFGSDLYDTVRTQPGNLAISPYSVAVALAMTRAGAAGVTAEEMDRVLHAELLGDPHDAFGSLDAALATRSATFPTGDGEDLRLELSFGNALWPQRDFVFLQPFLDTLAARYGAGVHVVDYADDTEGARRSINEWVGDQTRARIPELIPPGVLSELTRLVLTNAVYLHAPWEHPFDADATADRPFSRLDGTAVDVPSMRLHTDLGYVDGEQWQAVALPYVGGDLEMVVLVPDDGAFDAVEDALDATTITTVGTGLQPRTVDLALPRWEYRTHLSLTDPLIGLGMPSAFSGAADLSAMSPEPLAITDVLHEVFVSVDEDGTEAAAATAVVVGETAAPPTEPVRLTIDRPFLYWILDRPTGAVLFLGRVLDPTVG